MSDAYRRVIEGERPDVSTGIHARATLAKLRDLRYGPREKMPLPVYRIRDAMDPAVTCEWRLVGQMQGESTVYELIEKRSVA